VTGLQRFAIAIALVLTALIVVVVAVGLARGNLDPTGTATMLGGVLTGIVGGLLLRRGGD
jgi:hypothetical protein